jgi:hypothetical protein
MTKEEPPSRYSVAVVTPTTNPRPENKHVPRRKHHDYPQPLSSQMSIRQPIYPHDNSAGDL